jgi:hypothetical protein
VALLAAELEPAEVAGEVWALGVVELLEQAIATPPVVTANPNRDNNLRRFTQFSVQVAEVLNQKNYQ